MPLWHHAGIHAATQAPVELECWHIPETPIMRHSLLLATSIDLESLSGRDYTTLKLRHANATMKEVRLAIEAYKRHDSDVNSTRSESLMSMESLLFAIMALAKQSRSTSITALPDTIGLFKPPFPFGLRYLNLWGQDDGDRIHRKALQSLISSRYDLAHMEFSTPGFSEVVAQFRPF